jgi:hypothetical protein
MPFARGSGLLQRRQALTTRVCGYRVQHYDAVGLGALRPRAGLAGSEVDISDPSTFELKAGWRVEPTRIEIPRHHMLVWHGGLPHAGAETEERPNQAWWATNVMQRATYVYRAAPRRDGGRSP